MRSLGLSPFVGGTRRDADDRQLRKSRGGERTRMAGASRAEDGGGNYRGYLYGHAEHREPAEVWLRTVRRSFVQREPVSGLCGHGITDKKKWKGSYYDGYV